MKSTYSEFLSWMDSQPQITRKSIKEKIAEIENRGKVIKPPRETVRFAKPAIDEILNYCQERGNNIEAEQFFDFYESKNWMIGKTKMKDYKAAIRTWERSSINKAQQPKLIGRQTQETVKNNLTFIPIQL